MLVGVVITKRLMRVVCQAIQQRCVDFRAQPAPSGSIARKWFAKLIAELERLDQPATVPGGEDRGASPLDVMSASIAACAHYFAAAYLHARGLSPEGLTVEVTAEKERVPVSRIGRLVLKLHLPAGLDERHRTGVERAIKSCPAYGTLLHPPSVEISIERPAVAQADEISGNHRHKVVG